MRTLLKIVIPVLLAIGIFITIEVSLRFFDYGFSASYVIQKQTSGGSRAILNPSALLAYTGLSVVNFSKEAFLNISVNKSENDIRVLFLGGSAAYGPFHAPDLGIARYLEAMLELQFPDNNINVINLAFPSLNSSAVKRILQDALMLRPDFVVYYGAANELGRAAIMQKSALSPDAVFFLQEMVYAVKRLKTYQLAVTIAGKYMRDTAEFFIKDHYKDFQSFQHLRPQVQKALGESFRYNLKEIKALCRENDIPIFLCTYAHNMKNLCTADPFSEQTGPHDIKPQLALLQQAYGLEKAGDYEGAIKLYKQSRRALPRFAAPLCHMAFCYYALDRPRQAAGAYKKARSRSVGYSAQLKNFNQVLRNMAAASSEDDVFLIDIVSALKKASP